jgi:hypothetical protein
MTMSQRTGSMPLELLAATALLVAVVVVLRQNISPYIVQARGKPLWP